MHDIHRLAVPDRPATANPTFATVWKFALLLSLYKQAVKRLAAIDVPRRP
jgi:hypothetical protein